METACEDQFQASHRDAARQHMVPFIGVRQESASSGFPTTCQLKCIAALLLLGASDSKF
jgi:hypothetical protein